MTSLNIISTITNTALSTATATAISRFWQCPDGWPQDGTWCNYYPDGTPTSAPPHFLFDDASRILRYALTTFLVLRLLTRTSTTALVGICLIVAGLVYDANLVLPNVHAAATTAAFADAVAKANASDLPMFHAKDEVPYIPGPPAPGDGPNLHSEGPYVPFSVAGRLAPTIIWLVCAALVCLFLAGIAGRQKGVYSCKHYDSWEALKSARGDLPDLPATTSATVDAEADQSASFATRSCSTGSESDKKSMAICMPHVARLLSKRKEIKRTEAPIQQEDKVPKIDGAETNPGSMKLVLLLMMLLLAAMMVPMALAEPTSTIIQSSTLSLPSPSPCSEFLATTGTAVCSNNTLSNLEQKDKPQSWIYVSSGTSEHRTHSLWLLVPLVLIGNFLLPTVATLAVVRWLRCEPLMGASLTLHQGLGSRMMNSVATTHAAADLHKRIAQAELSPIWVTSYTTTTTYLPTVTITALPDSEANPADSTIGAVGNVWQPAPAGIEGICTERNLAVCPVVLGRKSWELPVSGGLGKKTSKVVLVTLIAGLVAVAVTESDYPVYLPIETTKALHRVIGVRGAVDGEPMHSSVGTPLQRHSTEESTPAATFTELLDEEHLTAQENSPTAMFTRISGEEYLKAEGSKSAVIITKQLDRQHLMMPDTGSESSTCTKSDTFTSATSTASDIIATGRNRTIDGSSDSGAGGRVAGVGSTGLAAGIWAFAAGIALLLAFAV